MQLSESSKRVMDSIYRKVILRKKAVLEEKEEIKPIVSESVEEKKGRLILTLNYGEEVKIGEALVTVTKRSPTQIKITVKAPTSVPIKRIKNGIAVPRRESDSDEN